MSIGRGATAEDWFHFDFVLGLGGNLLPCVPAAADVKVLAGSALEGKVGKIPSQFNAAGEAHGLLAWQKRPILGNEVKIWAADRRLNLCVRTGPISNIYAFDVDVDTADAESIFNKLERSGLFGSMFFRGRENSRKFLLPFFMDASCRKRKIKLDSSPRGPAIELLADGQQFVAAGSHASGVRYRWLPELPTHLPVLTLAQLDQLWETLASSYAVSVSTGAAYSSETGSISTDGETRATGSTSPLRTEITESEWLELISALRFLTDKAGDNDVWSQIGYALLSLEKTRPARQLWIEFSQKAAGYTPGAPEDWWETHHRAETRTDYRHIFGMARQRGWSATSAPEVFAPVADASPSARQVAPEPSNAPGPDRPDTPASTGSDLLAPLPDKPDVRLVAKDFSQIIDQLEQIAQPELYTQGDHLVYRAPGHDDDEIRRSTDQIMLVRVSSAYARKRLGQLARFLKFDPKTESWSETAPSAEHINALIEQGTWTQLRPLDAIVRAPFVRQDGTICDTAGYDKTSRALLIPSATFPEIPKDPSKSEAQLALLRIRSVFHQFPWATSAAESGFLAHVLSEAGRLAFTKCPMFFYNAPTAGTGKTLLQKAASVIAHGAVPALRPWLSDGDEIRKTVYASLLAGDRSLLFDNVPDGFKIRSAELCAAITAENWQDRKLGESESHAVPNRAVFSASGNNIVPAGDLARRSIVIRLDANTERLSQRRFDIEDLESYLVRERPGLLVDALTIMRAYHRTNATDVTMPIPLPSFEQWSHFVREPLIWLEMPDPVETQKRDANEDTQNLGAVFTLLCARFGSTEFTGVDVARLGGGISDTNGQLTNALVECGCKEPNSPRAIGYFLRGNRDKVFGGMKLVGGAHTLVGAKWKFVKVE